MRVRPTDLLWLVPITIGGWLLAGPAGLVVGAAAGAVGLRWPRLPAAYAAAVLVAAALATLLEARLGGDARAVGSFVSFRPTAGALGQGAGVVLLAAVVSGVRSERVREPAPVGASGSEAAPVRRAPLTGLTVVAVAVAVVTALAQTPVIRLVGPIALLLVGGAWILESRRPTST